MIQRSKRLKDEAATQRLGMALAASLPSPGMVYLSGDLGSGKTTLVRALLQALGYRGPVRSPTYTLVESYAVAGRVIHHLDLYRLAHPEELSYIGIEEYLQGDATCFIEWPERGLGVLPACDVQLHWVHQDGERLVRLTAHSLVGERWLSQLQLT